MNKGNKSEKYNQQDWASFKKWTFFSSAHGLQK